MRHLFKIITTIILVSLGLLGCDAQIVGGLTRAAAGALVSKKTFGASLTGYNHPDKFIGAFYENGAWGGNISQGTGGGSFVCCADLPNPWHEGLSVTVEWEDEESQMHKRVVPVPQYDAKTTAGFKVHFLRNGELKVFAGPVYLGHRDYPLKGVEAELKPGVPIEILEEVTP